MTIETLEKRHATTIARFGLSSSRIGSSLIASLIFVSLRDEDREVKEKIEDRDSAL